MSHKKLYMIGYIREDSNIEPTESIFHARLTDQEQKDVGAYLAEKQNSRDVFRWSVLEVPAHDQVNFSAVMDGIKADIGNDEDEA